MPEISDTAVEKATGRSPADWRTLLDVNGCAQMEHAAIASLLRAQGVDHCWAQLVTVEYERAIGRRAVGQRCDGTYSASASRTLPGEMDAVLMRWQSAMEERAIFDGTLAEEKPRVSATAKWRYWRLGLEDGSQVVAMISAKGSDKVTLTINHDRLADALAVGRWKAYWKAELAGF